MGVHDQEGFVSKSFYVSLAIHFGVVTALIAAPHVKDLPLVKELAPGVMEMAVVQPTAVEITINDIPEKIDPVIVEKAIEMPQLAFKGQDTSEIKLKTLPEKRQVAKKIIKKLPAKKAVAPISAEEVKEYFADATPVQAKEEINDLPEKMDPEIEDLNTEVETEAFADQMLPEEADQIAEASSVAESLENIEPALNEEPVVEQEAMAQEKKIAAAPSLKQIKSSELKSGAPKTNSLGGAQDGRLLRQVVGNPIPRYPELSRRKRQSGTVVLGYYVNKAGAVKNMKIIKSSGHKLLDKEAMSAISKWKFVSGQEGATVHPTTFTLNGIEKRMPSRLRTSGTLKKENKKL